MLQECTNNLFPTTIEYGNRKPFHRNFTQWTLTDLKEFLFGYGFDIERFEDIEWEAEARFLNSLTRMDKAREVQQKIGMLKYKKQHNTQTIGLFFEEAAVPLTFEERQNLKKLEDEKDKVFKIALEQNALTEIYCHAGQALQYWHCGSKAVISFLSFWFLTPFGKFEEKTTGFYRPKDTWGYRLRWTSLSLLLTARYAFASYQHFMMYQHYSTLLQDLKTKENDLLSFSFQEKIENPSSSFLMGTAADETNKRIPHGNKIVNIFASTTEDQKDEIFEQQEVFYLNSIIMKSIFTLTAFGFGFRALSQQNTFVRRWARATACFCVADVGLMSVLYDVEVNRKIRDLFSKPRTVLETVNRK